MTRRPDIELPDAVATYVETHAEEITRLASRASRDELRAELADRPRLTLHGRTRLRAALVRPVSAEERAAEQAWFTDLESRAGRTA